MSKTPASMSTIEPAAASPSRWIEVFALATPDTSDILPSAPVSEVVNDIKSAAATTILSAASMLRIPASISTTEAAAALPSIWIAVPLSWSPLMVTLASAASASTLMSPAAVDTVESVTRTPSIRT